MIRRIKEGKLDLGVNGKCSDQVGMKRFIHSSGAHSPHSDHGSSQTAVCVCEEEEA